MNFTIGTIYSKQQFNSNIFQVLDNGSELDTTPIAGVTDVNDTDYTFSDVYLGLHYRWKTGKFTGVSAHAYSAINTHN